MFCIKCGSMIPDGSKFCENCGEPQMTASVDKNLESAYNDIAASQNNEVVPELELPEETQFEMPKELTTAEAQVGEPVVTTDMPKEDTADEIPVLTTEPEVQQEEPAQQEAAASATPVQPQATQAQAQTQWQQPQTQQFNNQGQQSSYQSNYQNANPNNTSYQPAYGYQPPKKSKTGLIIGIVVAVLLIVAAVGLILGGGLSGSNKGYSSPDKAIQAYFQAVERGDEDRILAVMPKGWADAVCDTEGYSSEHEFLYNYDYSVYCGYLGKEIESYYVDDEYTETLSSADVESVNAYYSPRDDFENIEVYYADCTFEDGEWDTFGIYVAEINNKYYIINVY